MAHPEPDSGGASSSSRAKPKAPVQAGIWPSANENVAKFKKQNISSEERIQRDIRNEKKKRIKTIWSSSKS